LAPYHTPGICGFDNYYDFIDINYQSGGVGSCSYWALCFGKYISQFLDGTKASQ